MIGLLFAFATHMSDEADPKSGFEKFILNAVVVVAVGIVFLLGGICLLIGVWKDIKILVIMSTVITFLYVIWVLVYLYFLAAGLLVLLGVFIVYNFYMGIMQICYICDMVERSQLDEKPRRTRKQDW
ncbi:uncharacterized protein LOC115621659 isoform X1 [Scaptodrosophila lebanonensis]|uniref:Uncharacterized protein LOC115621659 isoform X1 n=1 Tax=Drosophila lebanonensis TaxID=7225 RepID=A0A6J2T7G0_DROLE|nr:uncharacterized protein LOC115621659 isoform X1 [Scaptodrosophila lebanonensis]